MPDKEKKDDTMFGLHEVKVKKTEMIAKLKVNRKKHKEDYEEAKAEYKLCYMDALAEIKNSMKASLKSVDTLIKLEDLNRENLPDLHFPFHLQAPINHLECYDSTLDMIEASVHDFIILTSSEFNKYYRDNWDWKDGFSSTVHMYKCSASSRSISTK